MPDDLRTALREVGLSQSGFARTLVTWGDPRSFDVVLRWVQRAIAGGEGGPHIDMVIRLLREHIARRKLHRRTIRLLESGSMKSGQNTGAGWEDTTAWSIAEFKRQVAELDKLLAECRLEDSMPALSPDEINAEALRRFQRIYVIPTNDDESAYLVWDSHRLLPFAAPDAPGTLIEDAMVYVDSLAAIALDPVYARIAAAGGERGIVRAASPE